MKYVWIIYSMNQIGKQLSMKRLFTKEQEYSIYDEIYVNDNIILFCKKCKNGDCKSLVALKRKIV